MKVSKAWLQTYFDSPLPDTDELVRRITFGIFEVEEVVHVGDDDVLDVKVLPDRSSYALSHRGIAKEISALIKQPLKKDSYDLSQYPLEVDDALETASLVTLEIQDTTLCRRAMKRLAVEVKVGPSPEWLVKKLATLGQRSINNVVDIANYVMLDTGQPVHTFDFDKLKGEKKTIAIKRATDGEQITTLDGATYTLDSNMLVIHDGHVSLDIAGIKGGKESGIDENTTRVLLSVCNFDPVSVRKTSRKLKLTTDASVRFQNNPSPELTTIAMHHLSRLLHEVAGAKIANDVLDVYPNPFVPHVVTVTVPQINALLGANISAEEVGSIFSQLGLTYKQEDETFTATPPFERTDLNIKEDLIEEVGRVYGYENIKAVLPLMPKEKSPVNKSFYYAEKVRHVLAELGFSEVYTYTLRDKGEVELENPLAKDKAFMRANLADGIRESLELNAHHAPLLGLDAVKIFEIGTVFNPPAGGGEHMSLAFGVKNKKAKEILEQALNMLKQVIPGIQGDTKDSVIEIHFDQAIQALPEPDAYESLPEETLKTYQPFSLYPFVLRDIALWVPEAVMESKIIELIKQQGGDLLVRVDLFDTFKKDGKISYAFHLVFQSKEKTLTDAEVGGIMDRITSTLKKEGGEVR
jgi:phenylalanyl-tRNA synthetase beta chain